MRKLASDVVLRINKIDSDNYPEVNRSCCHFFPSVMLGLHTFSES